MRQWENFMQQPTDAVKSIVREFYANHKVSRGMTKLKRSLELQRHLSEAHRKLMEAHWRQSREHIVYMHEFTVVLAQRFLSSSSDNMPFHVPPTWPEAAPLDEEEQHTDDDEDITDGDTGNFLGS